MVKLNKKQLKCAECSELCTVLLQEDMTFYTCCSETEETISVLFCKKCKKYSLRND